MGRPFSELEVVSYILPVVGPAVAPLDTKLAMAIIATYISHKWSSWRYWQWSNILMATHIVLGDERQLLELMQVRQEKRSSVAVS